jgi:hypothetical protein
MRKRNSLLAVASALTIFSTASPAWAHDCFIASRSATGDAMAAHSSRWVVVTINDFVHSEDFPPGVDPDCFIAYWSSHGGPASFTVRSDKVIGEGSKNPNLADGRGLDHIDEAYGPLFGAALGSCAQS